MGKLIEEKKFKYYEYGDPTNEKLVLLHGLMGELSNFEGVIEYFQKTHHILFPVIPIYEMPVTDISVENYVEHIARFLEYKTTEKVHLIGNSLGGHLGVLFTLNYPEKVKSLTLTGSSGLYENAFGTTFPRRGDYDYITRKAQETFYDPAMATKELVDGLFEAVTDRGKALRILLTSKSAIRHNVANRLHEVYVPTLLIWGKQDIVTPPFVGEKFHELIRSSKLYFIDKCGHAPMIEHPEVFNKIVETFFQDVSASKVIASE